MNINNLSNTAIDQFDKLILNVLQENNQISHAQIGEMVGLSTSATRRRIKRLRKTGVIAQDVSLVNTNGHGVQLIVTIEFGDETIEAYNKLDLQIKKYAHIQQAYYVAGTSDYVLIIHAPNLSWYENWSKNTFMTNPNIKKYSSQVVWTCKKFSTKVEL